MRLGVGLSADLRMDGEGAGLSVTAWLWDLLRWRVLVASVSLAEEAALPVAYLASSADSMLAAWW